MNASAVVRSRRPETAPTVERESVKVNKVKFLNMTGAILTTVGIFIVHVEQCVLCLHATLNHPPSHFDCTHGRFIPLCHTSHALAVSIKGGTYN